MKPQSQPCSSRCHRRRQPRMLNLPLPPAQSTSSASADSDPWTPCHQCHRPVPLTTSCCLRCGAVNAMWADRVPEFQPGQPPLVLEEVKESHIGLEQLAEAAAVDATSSSSSSSAFAPSSSHNLGLPTAFLAKLSGLRWKLVLVTSGVGFLGGHIVQVLLQAGARVRVFEVVLPKENHGIWKKEDPVEMILGKLTLKGDVELALTGCWAVIHTASPPSTSRNTPLCEEVNVDGTGVLLEGCRSKGVKRFVYTSSANVVFDGCDQRNVDESAPKPVTPMDAYTKSKWEGEGLVLGANGDKLWTTAIRSPGVFGFGDEFLPRLVQACTSWDQYRIGDGSNLMDFTYVENVAYAHALAACQLRMNGPVNGKAYFITNREPISVRDFIPRICRAWGHPSPWIQMSFVKSMAMIIGYVGSLVNLPTTVHDFCYDRYYSSARAVKEMDYQPPIDMDEAIKRSANYWDLRHKEPPVELAGTNQAKGNRNSITPPGMTFGFGSSTLLKNLLLLTVLSSFLFANGFTRVLLILILTLVAYLFSIWRDSFGQSTRSFELTADTPALQSKVILITGASSGLGFLTAMELLKRGFAFTQNGELFITGRDREKGEAAASALRAKYPSARIRSFVLDLGSFESVRALVKELKTVGKPIDLLIHHAGAMVEAGVTPDGHDTQFQVNYLSHFLLTQLLLSTKLLSPASRIINITSNMHRCIGTLLNTDWTNMQDSPHLKPTHLRPYKPFGMYCRTKLLQLLWMAAQQRRFNQISNQARRMKSPTTEVNRRTIICVNPGVVTTDFIHQFILINLAPIIDPLLRFVCPKTFQEGVQTILYASLSPELDNVGGVYVDNCRVCLPSPIAQDEELQEFMYHQSEAWQTRPATVFPYGIPLQPR